VLSAQPSWSDAPPRCGAAQPLAADSVDDPHAVGLQPGVESGEGDDEAGRPHAAESAAFLDEVCPRSGTCGPNGGRHAGRAAADDENVDVGEHRDSACGFVIPRARHAVTF